MAEVKAQNARMQLLKWLWRLVGLRQVKKGPRTPGVDAGQVWIADDFDDPLPPEIQKYFE